MISVVKGGKRCIVNVLSRKMSKRGCPIRVFPPKNSHSNTHKQDSISLHVHVGKAADVNVSNGCQESPKGKKNQCSGKRERKREDEEEEELHVKHREWKRHKHTHTHTLAQEAGIISGLFFHLLSELSVKGRARDCTSSRFVQRTLCTSGCTSIPAAAFCFSPSHSFSYVRSDRRKRRSFLLYRLSCNRDLLSCLLLLQQGKKEEHTDRPLVNRVFFKLKTPNIINNRETRQT